MTDTLAMNDPSTPKEKPRFFGHWIPWVFVGLFLLVLAANGTLIYVAVSTFTGLETSDAYKKGLDYNDRLAVAERQEQLGWQAVVEATANAQKQVTLTLTLNDRLEAPITSADVEAEFVRPVQAGHDLTVPLEDQGGGRYAAVVDLPLAGQWDVHFTARARENIYRLVERIHIEP
ncbi:MAG: FixH family protein [Geminicoccaceae bacterium]